MDPTVCQRAYNHEDHANCNTSSPLASPSRPTPTDGCLDAMWYQVLPSTFIFSGTVEKETRDTRYQCSLHLYAPRHSCFVPPHTIRSEDTYQNADVRIVIGRVVSTLAGLASPSGPIAAGTVQTVPAFTNSPASKRYSHHAPQKPTVTTVAIYGLSRSYDETSLEGSRGLR